MSSGWKKRFGLRGTLLTVGVVVGSAGSALANEQGGSKDRQQQSQWDKDWRSGTGGSGGQDDGKGTVCHKGRTLRVGSPAVNAHLRHGDSRGACGTGGSGHGHDHDKKHGDKNHHGGTGGSGYDHDKKHDDKNHHGGTGGSGYDDDKKYDDKQHDDKQHPGGTGGSGYDDDKKYDDKKKDRQGNTGGSGSKQQHGDEEKKSRW